MIDRERLAETFMGLVRIDSVSKREARLARELEARLADLGAQVLFDDAGKQLDGEVGNLIARFQGNTDVPPLLLNAHMDTVEPGAGVEPQLTDGVFTSRGETILGADDKSAIAILLEVLEVIRGERLPCGPLDVVLTVCEEIGLRGAKHLDFSKIRAGFGYALDATDTEGIVTRAPAANRFEIEVIGKDAHAGAAPEKGINAILVASRAMAGLEIGRIDRETTCNIGYIQGGSAVNIVPNRVTIRGEARSHDEGKLARVTETILDAFRRAAEDHQAEALSELPKAKIRLEHDFHRTHIEEDHPVVRLAAQAAENLGRRMATKRSGGGADANIFFRKGIPVGVLGTGMRDMHTTREWVRLEDMVKTAELVLEILRIHASGGGNR